MEFRNVCFFPNHRSNPHTLNPVNYVRETEKLTDAARTESVYKIHFIESGRGVLLVRGVSYPLAEGDVFFTFPSMTYSIVMEGAYSCIYISFLGTRGNEILERLGINSTRFFFPGCGALRGHFSVGLQMGCEVSEWMSESVLLYAFAFLRERLMPSQDGGRMGSGTAQRIKAYIDENFADPELCLEKIGSALAFHPKYVSSIFKRELHLGVSEYVSELRIQNACALMNGGYRSVSEIAARCGFTEGQYFSKVFKKKTGITPFEYIQSLR